MPPSGDAGGVVRIQPERIAVPDAPGEMADRVPGRRFDPLHPRAAERLADERLRLRHAFVCNFAPGHGAPTQTAAMYLRRVHGLDMRQDFLREEPQHIQRFLQAVVRRVVQHDGGGADGAELLNLADDGIRRAVQDRAVHQIVIGELAVVLFLCHIA